MEQGGQEGCWGRRAREASAGGWISLWGTGNPLREEPSPRLLPGVNRGQFGRSSGGDHSSPGRGCWGRGCPAGGTQSVCPREQAGRGVSQADPMLLCGCRRPFLRRGRPGASRSSLLGPAGLRCCEICSPVVTEAARGAHAELGRAGGCLRRRVWAGRGPWAGCGGWQGCPGG